jgi:DNA-binding NarL/FixJ family response regulator
VWRRLGDRYAYASNLEAIAVLELKRGRLAECQRDLDEVCATLRSLAPIMPTDVLEIGVMLAAARKDYERVVTLAAAGQVYRGRAGLAAFAEDSAAFNRNLSSARDALGPQRAAEADAVGRLLSFDAALKVIASVDGLGSEDGPSSRLSRREFEVAAVLSRGLSNRDIAKTLGISSSTVEVHIENIRRKLGFNSRTEVAVWFARNEAGSTVLSKEHQVAGLARDAN